MYKLKRDEMIGPRAVPRLLITADSGLSFMQSVKGGEVNKNPNNVMDGSSGDGRIDSVFRHTEDDGMVEQLANGQERYPWLLAALWGSGAVADSMAEHVSPGRASVCCA